VARLFHKAYSNSSTYYAGSGGSVDNEERPDECEKVIKKIRQFLRKYQDVYKTTGRAMIIPNSLDEYIKSASKLFRIECDNIENIIKYIERKHFPYQSDIKEYGTIRQSDRERRKIIKEKNEINKVVLSESEAYLRKLTLNGHARKKRKKTIKKYFTLKI